MPDDPDDERRVERAPPAARPLGRALAWMERGVDALWGSRFNPLYKSGALAIGLFLVALVTGVYLLFFYRVGAPYQSVRAISTEVPLGSLMRSLHRYASDGAMLATAFHVLRMFVEGKAHGPRILAWTSGVILLGIMMFIGLTGYVMIWDEYARALALAGAEILDLLPMLGQPMARAFTSNRPLGSSFFFLNLFFHLALPLALLGGLWLHTLKLSQPAWLPKRDVLLVITAALVVLSLMWPAPLAPPADPLRLTDAVPNDWFYTPWLPLAWALSPGVFTGLAVFLTVGFLLAPWWWKPPAERAPRVSQHVEERCEGCEQCVKDCPYDAITMVPRTKGEGSELVARVDPGLCTGCGVCAASCSQLAIGPPHVSARFQLQEAILLRRAESEAQLAVIFCRNEFSSASIERLEKAVPHLAFLPYDCIGALHTSVLAVLTRRFKGVFVLACAPGTCERRLGESLAFERHAGDRGPKLRSSRLDPQAVFVSRHSQGEERLLTRELRQFARARGLEVNESASATGRGAAPRWLGAAALTLVSLLALGFLSTQAVSPTEGADRALLRVDFTLPATSQEVCRTPTEAEQAALPLHMRVPRICQRSPARYRVRVAVDGAPVLDEEVQGSRGSDREFFLLRQEFPIEPGERALSVQITPLEDPTVPPSTLSLPATLSAGHAVLLSFDPAHGLEAHVPNPVSSVDPSGTPAHSRPGPEATQEE